MHGLDIVGADSTGGLFTTLTQAGTGIADWVKQSEADKATAASDEKKAQAAISADIAAVNARYRALVSANDPTQPAATVKADQMAADSAAKTQDKAGAAVPDSKQQERVDAAQKMVDSAQSAVADATSVAAKTIASYRLQAAQETLTKAQSGGGGASDTGGGGSGKGKKGGGTAEGGSFLTKTIVGPVKVWYGLVALAAAVGGVLLYRWKK